MSDSLWPHEPQHAMPPCPSQLPVSTQTHVHWVGDAIQPSHPVVIFFSCPQSFPASGSFPTNQLFASGNQSIRVSSSTSVPPKNTQDWSPLGWTSWISLLFSLINTKLGFPYSLTGKERPAMQETPIRFLGWEDLLEKEMATHSSILAWRIPWTEEPGRLLSIG